MVDFVHEGASEIIVGFDADFTTILELGFDFDFAGTGDETIDFGDREAAFVLGDGATFGADDFGIDEGGKGIVLFVIKIVTYDNDALIDTHLGGGHGGR